MKIYTMVMLWLCFASGCGEIPPEGVAESAEEITFCCTGEVASESGGLWLRSLARICVEADDPQSAAGIAVAAWAARHVYPDPSTVYDPETGENSCSPQAGDVWPGTYYSRHDCIGRGIRAFGFPAVRNLAWSGWANGSDDAAWRAYTTWTKQGWTVIANETICWESAN